MEYILGIVFVVVVVYLVFRKPETLDVNKDGKVDLADAKAAVEKVETIAVEGVGAVKVAVAEAEAKAEVVVEEVKVAAKKTAAKAKAAVKTATTKKPRAKKTAE